MANRKKTKRWRWFIELLVGFWRIRLAVALAFIYLLVIAWLLSGDRSMDLRPSEIYAVPEDPVWEKPDRDHWFGTTGNGVDLFQLTRTAMATSVAISVFITALGVFIALLFVMICTGKDGGKSFGLIRFLGRTAFIAPSLLVLLILLGGSGGRVEIFILGFAALIAIHFAPTIADWFEEGEDGFHVVAGYALGLSRSDLVLQRLLPKVLRRCAGLFASLLPSVVLVEMTLSFLGMTGERLSCGAMIAEGQHLMIEAPWMSIYPGVMAFAVVSVMGLLGSFVSRLIRRGSIPRLF